MTIGEQLYLALVLAAVATFAITLAVIARQTNRFTACRAAAGRTKEPEQPFHDAA